MYEFQRRQNNLSIPASELSNTNERIKKFQQATGVDFESPSRLFFGLLDYFEKNSVSADIQKDINTADSDSSTTLLVSDNPDLKEKFRESILQIRNEGQFNDVSDVEIVLNRLTASVSDDTTDTGNVLVMSPDKPTSQVFEQRFLEFEEKFELVGKSRAECINIALGSLLRVGPGDDKPIVSVSYLNDEEIQQYSEAIQKYKQEVLEDPDSSDAAALVNAIENASIDMAELIASNTENRVAPPMEIPEGSILLTFSDVGIAKSKDKIALLQLVSKNRQQKYGYSNPETISEIVEKIVFQKAVICNYHGIFYTGFTTRGLKKTT